ncbi:MAG: c-type cytochrome [Candidatus Hydrogenedentes bacterium]|nr:c-type cytochrome [Candidatus Hydrogenedentota bacterium]
MKPTQKRFPGLVWAVISGIGFAFPATAEDVDPFVELPESPIEGGRLFMEKGCINCHAIQGLGGIGGPDLGKVQAAWSFLDIAGVMWNHQPKMAAEFERRKLARPQLSSEEVFDLIAFVYFLNYFGNPGDPAKGELLFLREQCVTCHSVGKYGPANVQSLDRFQSYRSPASITAALWNGSKKMTDAMQTRNVPRPVYQANDVADLLAFIRREASPQEQIRPVFLRVGDSRAGAELFHAKGCIQCHAVRGEGGAVGPALGSWKFGGVLSQMAGAIWNHGPDMWGAMEKAGIEFPVFTENEMSDLMTYLYFSSFADSPGDPAKGAELFAEKGCLGCHWGGEQGKVAPGRTVSEMNVLSAADVIAAMWNHAAEMEQAIRAADIAWPQVRPGEMGDLVAFIKSQKEAGGDQR